MTTSQYLKEQEEIKKELDDFKNMMLANIGNIVVTDGSEAHLISSEKELNELASLTRNNGRHIIYCYEDEYEDLESIMGENENGCIMRVNDTNIYFCFRKKVGTSTNEDVVNLVKSFTVKGLHDALVFDSKESLTIVVCEKIVEECHTATARIAKQLLNNIPFERANDKQAWALAYAYKRLSL